MTWNFRVVNTLPLPPKNHIYEGFNQISHSGGPNIDSKEDLPFFLTAPIFGSGGVGTLEAENLLLN